MENLGLDLKLLIAQLVNFLIFFFVFYRFMAKPFIQFLTKEQKREEEKQTMLNSLKKREEEFDAKEKKLRQEMKKEMDQVIKQARQDAESVRQEIMEQTKKEADQYISRTRKQLDEERNELYRDVKRRTADLSILLVNKALSNYLNDDAKKKVTEYILANASRDNN